jgi:hypothetical protein
VTGRVGPCQPWQRWIFYLLLDLATIVPIQGTTSSAQLESMPRGRPTPLSLFETPLSETQKLRVTRNSTDYYITKYTGGRQDPPPQGRVKVKADVSADKIMAKSAVSAEVAAAVVAAIQGAFQGVSTSHLTLRRSPDARDALRAPTNDP